MVSFLVDHPMALSKPSMQVGDDESMVQKSAAAKKCLPQKRAHQQTESSRKILVKWDQIDDMIWVKGVLPFLGMGHYAFVAGVNRRMKNLYLMYCSTVDMPPSIKAGGFGLSKQATSTDTLYTAVCASVTRAEYCRAAQNGHLDVLKYAHDNGCPWHEYTCFYAAMGGHYDILEYAHTHGCRWDSLTSHHAAAGGHIDCLKYAHENNCPWDANTCSLAAERGQLKALKFAHENGCPWDASTCSKAAKGGHLRILKYARENGCSWDEWTCIYAARSKHLQVLRWAQENGCPCPPDLLEMALV
ncbi:ankyrin repeat protein [Seminavis robusta]|uniref:Ankyrin repeat protein n=1 Tax=Seminavis robusta TaxID=568900 RepID=A0A9N8H830_9STRA|nr:ankyrin repeat protein [Seminavis robusta]|eukprot:Sro157_g071250.1 ankyrin repeat protein (301) ;mRNA; r:67135-68322